MGSVKSSAKRSRSAPYGVALLTVIVMQALGLGFGWSQQPAQPGMGEELTKQDEIYHSRGTKVPDGYVTYRGLTDYLKLLPSSFCSALGKLGSSDRWLDIGAGAGQAILDYYAPETAGLPTKECIGSGAKARAVAMSIEDRRTDKWGQQAASLGDDRLRYVFGKRLRNYSRDELGKFQIISDVYGALSYTDDLSKSLETVLSLLEIGGAFFSIVQNVHLDTAKDKPDTGYQTELVDESGRSVKICSWLKKTTCVKVQCESKSDWDSPSELINVQKVCNDVSVTRTKLLHFQAGNPPGRRFQLEPVAR